jgi:hypothetical protein
MIWFFHQADARETRQCSAFFIPTALQKITECERQLLGFLAFTFFRPLYLGYAQCFRQNKFAR